MKTKIIKFAAPVGVGLVLSVISIMGFTLTTFTSCDDTTQEKSYCTNKDYPLYCSQTGTCCPNGYAHLCDGKCYKSGCPNGTVHSSVCSQR